MPYFNIAYIREDEESCICILTESTSKENAREEFQSSNPNYRVVAVWARPDFVPAEKIDFDISVKNDGNLVHDGPAYSFLSGNGWDEDIISLVVKCGEIGGTVSEQFISGLWEISKKGA